ncbi:MAG TPA: Gfo/Idh/MocA family oxidoreductase [bacterium]|nr:Gfo/Idh/MocA family oxidoreductase [bacterium]HOM26652.1 Gfo/Idh/MocA family oxidoreductase [bacterium]
MKKLKVGIFGIKRGSSFANLFSINPNTEVVAICDYDELFLRNFLKDKEGITGYSGYDKFLEHDLDIVVVCNYCTEHAPAAIKALDSGRHVLSEVIACKTLAEGVDLCRAVERSKKVYMFGENYCFFPYIQEMERLYKEGVIGEYLYGECEYVHDCRGIWHIITGGKEHWRNWLPSTYYCTHSLGPIIKITKTRPLKVVGFVVPNKLSREVGRIGDDWGLFVCIMDNCALTRVIAWSTGPHDSIWYRVHGTKGAMENNRWKDTGVLNLHTVELTETLDIKEEKRSYIPEFIKYKEEAKKAGHGGSDFFVVWSFVDSIIKDEPPPIDIYTAMDMTLPGILAYRSACSGSIPLEVPDFRKEEERKKYENDRWSPDPKDRNIPGQPYTSILGEIKIHDEIYRKVDEKRRKYLMDIEEKIKK